MRKQWASSIWGRMRYINKKCILRHSGKPKAHPESTDPGVPSESEGPQDDVISSLNSFLQLRAVFLLPRFLQSVFAPVVKVDQVV